MEVMVESLGGESRPKIQEEGRVIELKIFLFRCSRRSWREANWVRLSAANTNFGRILQHYFVK